MYSNCCKVIETGLLNVIYRIVLCKDRNYLFAYLATATVLSALLGRDPLMDILSGGLLLGAIFMATDYTTSPINFSARVIYAVGCGVLTILIRQFASLPEGVSYSIVLMNILVPLIERVAKPQTFGKMKAKKAGDAK